MFGGRRITVTGAALLAAATMASAGGGQGTAPALEPCWLQGFEHEASCGRVRRPLDPAAPGGVAIDVHFAVLPALARRKLADPVFVFAGGPGQSAIDLAGSFSRLLARLAHRRDIVLIDQRGTGRSAPLACAEMALRTPLAQSADAQWQFGRLAECRAALQRLPHGDLRHYTTTVAMQDADAVRRALGAERVNLIGGSYGTRAALEFLRQFPSAVRRIVIDGVAPPDMVLPRSFSIDNQAALEAVFEACEAEAACRQRHRGLREDWRRLLQGLPREVAARHPFTGVAERFTLTRDGLLGLVRAPLYAPALAAALPPAIGEAAQGRFEALLGLASALQGARMPALAEGMHFSVICSEDFPRLVAASAGHPGAGGDFGDSFAALYRRVCADWPRGAVPPAFYDIAASPAPVLLLSGGADPATPPRHGERAARALGARARHVVVAEAGHGVMALPCVRELLARFIDAAEDAAALALQTDCAKTVPRPHVFVPVAAASAAAR